MNLNWLFGPEVSEQATATGPMLVMRPLLLDIERIKELCELLREIFPFAEVRVLIHNPGGVIRVVSEDSLPTLAKADRQVLSINSKDADGREVNLTFQQGKTPTITLGTAAGPGTVEQGKQLASLLLHGGVPRFDWFRLLVFIPIAMFAAFLALWWTLVTSEQLSTVAFMFGSSAVFVAFIVAVAVMFYLSRRARTRITSHRIRDDLRLTRRNHWLAFRLSLVGLLIGYFLGWITPSF